MRLCRAGVVGFAGGFQVDYAVKVWLGVVRLEGLCEHVHCRHRCCHANPSIGLIMILMLLMTREAPIHQTSGVYHEISSRPSFSFQFVVISHEYST